LKFGGIGQVLLLTEDGDLFDIEEKKMVKFEGEYSNLKFLQIELINIFVILMDSNRKVYLLNMATSIPRNIQLIGENADHIGVGIDNCLYFISNNQVHVRKLNYEDNLDNEDVPQVTFNLQSPVIEVSNGVIITEEGVVIVSRHGLVTTPLLGDYLNPSPNYKFIGCGYLKGDYIDSSETIILEEVHDKLMTRQIQIEVDWDGGLDQIVIYEVNTQVMRMLHGMSPFVRLIESGNNLALINKNGDIFELDRHHRIANNGIPSYIFKRPTTMKKPSK
jgi:ABC-type transport system substrate-binding protein